MRCNGHNEERQDISSAPVWQDTGISLDTFVTISVTGADNSNGKHAAGEISLCFTYASLCMLKDWGSVIKYTFLCVRVCADHICSVCEYECV